MNATTVNEVLMFSHILVLNTEKQFDADRTQLQYSDINKKDDFCKYGCDNISFFIHST